MPFLSLLPGSLFLFAFSLIVALKRSPLVYVNYIPFGVLQQDIVPLKSLASLHLLTECAGSSRHLLGGPEINISKRLDCGIALLLIEVAAMHFGVQAIWKLLEAPQLAVLLSSIPG
jgi:hypothetical protein